MRICTDDCRTYDLAGSTMGGLGDLMEYDNK